jgi:O-methyltransferase StaMB
MSHEKSPLAPAPDEVGHFYDSLALGASAVFGHNIHYGYWDDSDSETPFGEAADRLTDIMVDKLKIGPGSHVLDVGCGVGGPAVRIASTTGARITGISVSREQVALANSLAESAGLAERVVFQQADAMEMQFPAQSFDAAIALESIMHMDRGQALTQICQSLRPGGRLVLTDIFERVSIPAARRPTVDRICKILGITLVRVEDYPPLLRGAGLLFEEILDISERSVPKSHAWFLDRMNEARQNVETFDDEIARRLDVIDMDDIPGYGYLMLVAKRPTG